MSTPTSGIRDTTAHRVLIVDDHADSAELLGLLLGQAGCETRTAGNSKDALAAALVFLPHVALLDIGLPDADGYELLATLRAQPSLSQCRFVAVTGYASEEAARLGKAAGFHAYLTKPIDFAAVYRVVLGEPQAPTSAGAL